MRRALYNKFNRGEVDPSALMRVELDKINSSAELMENWQPERLGPMRYRAGLEFLGGIDAEAYFAEFIAATDDTALLEFTDDQLRVWVDDAPLERQAVTATVTNGNFDTDLSGWTDDSGGTGSSSWETGGFALLIGDGANLGAMYQTITITETGQEHAVRLEVVDAPVEFRIGTTVGAGDIFQGTLLEGTHSLVFTPTGNVTFWVGNRRKYGARIDSLNIEGAGEMTLPTGIEAVSDVRYAQSADVMFIAANGVAQKRVERRGVKSWSVTNYRAEDGPFGVINNTGITLAAGDLSGDVTLTASDDFFTEDHVGSLFKLSSASQNRKADVTAEDTGTGSIFVQGVGVDRRFTILITGTWTATVTLQRSPDDASWTDVESYTTNQSKTFNDGFDNAAFYYRLHVKTGDYTSGTVSLELNYAGGSIDGIGRVINYTSPTEVTVQALSEFGSTEATRDWYQGDWSDVKGYPSAVALHEGRLWWAGKNRVWGSVSDAFSVFDDSIEGDSGPIRKTVGFGPVDDIHWIFSSTQLVMGIASDEVVIRSSSFGEVLSPTNSNLRSGSNQGSANISPVKADSVLYFVQRSLEKIFSAVYAAGSEALQVNDLTMLNPRICDAGIKRIFIIRQPETRMYLVMNDGTARVYMFEQAEDISAWSRISVDGLIEDVVALPSESEDRVYFVINRGGVRCLHKMATNEESRGGSINKTLDSFVFYPSATTTISGLGHLDGETVGVWAEGKDRGDYVVSSGSITVPEAWNNVTVGLRYTATYVSNKLNAIMESYGTNVNQQRRVVRIGLVARDLWQAGFKYGSDEDHMYSLPLIEDGTDTDLTVLVDDYDELPFEFDGCFNPDARVRITATGPANLLSLVYEIEDPEYQASKQS